MPRKTKEERLREQEEARKAAEKEQRKRMEKLPPEGATFAKKGQEPIVDLNVQDSPSVDVPVSNTKPEIDGPRD